MNKYNSKLAELANKAGSEKWEYRIIRGDTRVIVKGSFEKGPGYISLRNVADEIDNKDYARFIAAANPSAIIDMLDYINAQAARIAELESEVNKSDQDNETLVSINSELATELEALREQEPDGYIFCHPAGRLFWDISDKSAKDHKDVKPFYFNPAPVAVPPSLHPDTADLVNRFAIALAEKLYAAQVKYGYNANWQKGDWQRQCLEHFNQHIAKGDPRDVAAYCAFMWHHGWKTSPPSAPVSEPDVDCLSYDVLFNAIAKAVRIQGEALGISVQAFRDALRLNNGSN